MEERLPLTEVAEDEILARVTYQIIAADYKRQPDRYEEPTTALLNLAVEWDLPDFSLIHEQITLAAIWCGNGGTLATWRRARIVFHTGRATRLARVGRTRTR